MNSNSNSPSRREPVAPRRDDHEVIAGCLEGAESDWSELYLRFHDRLMAAIRAMLRRVNRPVQVDDNLVDEIAARVWYLVVRDDHELLRRFDVDRGVSLATFLGVIAKSQVWQYFRSERRRRNREAIASKREELGPVAIDIRHLALEETFLKSLTPAEAKFYRDFLTHDPGKKGETNYTAANRWQLRHRVLEKFHDAMDEDAPQEGL